ncbi:MAG TPA: iron-sulfur cluster repair di-iron protein [Chthonomonadaceae bacterium]|nr:iron-sulfur cluster repair di-iron protein [Chthonomonadaceae bacterium]
MQTISTQDTIGRLVAERPGRSRIFERWGLDYCCGGKKTLEDACNEKALNLADLLSDLRKSDASPSEPATDWLAAPLGALADHITTTHHAYLREALPRLTFLTEKVRDAHGGRHPELIELAATFAAFRSELEQHMVKEERVLFPLIKQLEAAETLPAMHSGSVNHPIRAMETEHDDAGAALATMRRLTLDFTPPPGACNTYRAMLDALAELEADMHRHVHKENNILFPRVRSGSQAGSKQPVRDVRTPLRREERSSHPSGVETAELGSP